MESKICLDCHRVWMGGKDNKCNDCNKENVEIFSPEKHAELLIGQSNAWIQVWSKWGNCDLIKEVSQKLWDDGYYGAGTHINAFVEYLIDNQCECKNKKD